MMKEKFIQMLLILGAATTSAHSIEISFTGGFESGNAGSIFLEPGHFLEPGNAVGFFTVNNSDSLNLFSAAFSASALNTAISSGDIDILGVTTIINNETYKGAFTTGFNVTEAYSGSQLYVFAVDSSPVSGGADWEFSTAGLWTSSDWLIPGGIVGIADQFDLGNLDPSQTIWGGAVEIGDSGTYTAIMAPAIPEPSTYALMMMGVALGYTIYRRRKQG